jgi:hypothetical protein
MMLWLARASWDAWLAGEDGEPAARPGAGTAAAPAPLLTALWAGGKADPGELAGLLEQPASSRAAPEISAAKTSAVVRSGPRKARARGAVFMPLGRVRCVAGSACPATVR